MFYVQAVCAMLEQSEIYHKSKVVTDADLAMSSCLLPGHNYLPKSIHLLREVSGAEDWSEFEVHVCAAEGCRGCVYEQLDRSQWEAHRNDCCQFCGEARFQTSDVGGKLGPEGGTGQQKGWWGRPRGCARQEKG